MSEGNSEYHDVNVIRARGKVTVASMMKVLNHFKGKYYVLHDTDVKTCESKRKTGEQGGDVTYKTTIINNPAWTNNGKILDQMTESSRVVASVINFEEAYFSETVANDKPEICVNKIKSDPESYGLIKLLLDAILEKKGVEIPDGAIAWSSMDQIEIAVNERLEKMA